MLNLVANGSSGYNLTNSLRFRSSASAYLNRTPASTGSATTWTWSGWVKRGALGTTQPIFGAFVGGSNRYNYFRFDASDVLNIYSGVYTTGGSTTDLYAYVTNQVFRDPSAWYHIVYAVDTTQATSSNRVLLYVNGVQVTSFSTATAPTQNGAGFINQTVAHNIGGAPAPFGFWFDGYITEQNFVDGQQLTPSSFGSTNATTGVWQPKKYTGTYGTNGFYQKYASIATTSGSNTGLGKDDSGNGNYFNTNNISVTAGTTYDAMTDVPTLTSATVANFAVMNPLGNAVGNAPATLSEANLTCKNTATSYLGALGTIGLPTSGKFYWEVQLTQNSGASNLSVFGIAPSTVPLTGNQANYANSIAWYMGNTTIIQLPISGAISISGSGSTTSDVFQICYDGATGKVYFGKNNTFYNSAGASTGNPSSGTNETATLTTGDLLPWFFAYQEGAYFNFGQRPFSYTPPSGYVALNTYNLPTPTILQGNKYMDATTYTGTGAALNVTNAASFKPDFVWVKDRGAAQQHLLYDSIRGVYNFLSSNTTSAESTNNQTLTSFNTNGFGLGTNGTSNSSGGSFVGWQWQAGQGSSSSNTNGSITSTVSVNTTAGFSVVTYTGNGSSSGTVGHGLGVAPKMIIVKSRSQVGEDWNTYHGSLSAPATQSLKLNTTGAVGTSTSVWNSTNPTSSVFSVGNAGVNNNTSTYVAYCWAEIAGFSKFTSYTGNGSADGPFVYCNFRPKFVMIKRTVNAGGSWAIYDSSRNTYNVANLSLYPNLTSGDDTYDVLDLTSNGFKIRTSSLGVNQSGDTFIVAAFAENPFKNSNAR